MKQVVLNISHSQQLATLTQNLSKLDAKVTQRLDEAAPWKAILCEWKDACEVLRLIDNVVYSRRCAQQSVLTRTPWDWSGSMSRRHAGGDIGADQNLGRGYPNAKADLVAA
jgi:hypothetical protein